MFRIKNIQKICYHCSFLLTIIGILLLLFLLPNRDQKAFAIGNVSCIEGITSKICGPIEEKCDSGFVPPETCQEHFNKSGRCELLICIPVTPILGACGGQNQKCCGETAHFCNNGFAPNTPQGPNSTCICHPSSQSLPCSTTNTKEVSVDNCSINSCPSEFKCDAQPIVGPPHNCLCSAFLSTSTPPPEAVAAPPGGAGMACPGGKDGIQTAIGCIPTNPADFILAVSRLLSGVGGGIALLLMIAGAFRMITSAGNPDAVKAGSAQFTSAVIGLLFIIFAVLLLKVIGVDILNLPGFEK